MGIAGSFAVLASMDLSAGADNAERFGTFLRLIYWDNIDFCYLQEPGACWSRRANESHQSHA
ncbi:protein of unknown function [Bradyrhizobium vignae]|uniref:Uncharacterized protein n=1 Tax=Bradyrhizobium vignae TaxID=1549949 RepID=A0A2U3Q0E5_9BRAD|nr:protein of unknown function [Bradyrhizobium vignae]